MPGELIALDRVMGKGVASDTYHLDQSPESLATIRASSSYSAEIAAVHAMKEREHAEMLARAADDGAMRTFLALAPPRVSYGVIAAAIRGGDRSGLR